MKKKILGILVCMLIALPVLAITTLADPEPEFYVEFTDSKAKEIRISITNIGDEDAYEVEFIMIFPKPFPRPFAPHGNRIEGIITHLPAGSSYIVSSGPIFGFRLWGKVQVYVNGHCLIHGYKHIIGSSVVDPNFVYNKGGEFRTPDDLYFTVTNSNTSEVRVSIENTGDRDAVNVHWILQFSRFCSGHGLVRFEGTIDRISPKERVTVGSGPISGFNPWADIWAYVNNYGPAHGYKHIIGSNVITPKYIPNY